MMYADNSRQLVMDSEQNVMLVSPQELNCGLTSSIRLPRNSNVEQDYHIKVMVQTGFWTKGPDRKSRRHGLHVHLNHLALEDNFHCLSATVVDPPQVL